MHKRQFIIWSIAVSPLRYFVMVCSEGEWRLVLCCWGVCQQLSGTGRHPHRLWHSPDLCETFSVKQPARMAIQRQLSEAENKSLKKEIFFKTMKFKFKYLVPLSLVKKNKEKDTNNGAITSIVHQHSAATTCLLLIITFWPCDRTVPLLWLKCQKNVSL